MPAARPERAAAPRNSRRGAHPLWDARGDLHAWLQDGAALYVCGDANAMAKDVHATLLRILADQGSGDEAAAKAELDQLRRDGRYLRDVY